MSESQAESKTEYLQRFRKIQELENLPENIEKIGIQALLNAFAVHNNLGRSGLDTVEKNQYGDTALKGDIACEKAVLDTLTEEDLPIIVHSEEHGITTLPPDKEPELLGVLDGIDGSDVYKGEFGEVRYGTMFGIFSNTNPEYDDYLFAGIMEHVLTIVLKCAQLENNFVQK